MRITVTLDDAVHEKLAIRAKEEGRSIANMAGRLVDFALAEFDPGQVLALRPAPAKVPEPKPSKSPPTKGGNASSDRVVTDLAPPPRGPAPGAKKAKPVPTDDDAPHDPATCLHPKNRQRLLNGGAVVCDLCHGRVR
jgi:hypothetical protein